MIEKLKHKYALSSKGAKDMIRAFVAVTLSNLVLMLPVGLLYVLSSYLLDQQLPKEKLTFFSVESVVILICIALTTTFQYRATFLSTYVESGVRRRTLAEKLRKLPLAYFGKKDLADLTNTIMSDCTLLETASSHWIPELIGAMISTTIIVISLFFFDFRMALAAIWVMPIAFAIVLYSRKAMRKTHEKLAKVFLIILVLAVIQGAQILVQGIMSGDLVAYLILALLIPLTIFVIRMGLRGNQSYIDKYNEHVRQYNEPYLQKMIQLQEDGAKQDKALKELTNGWFPSAYLSPNVVLTFIDYMKKKRATTMKELANLYEMDKLYAHQMQMTQEIIDSNRSIDNQLRFSNMIGMYQIIQMDNIKDFFRRYW